MTVSNIEWQSVPDGWSQSAESTLGELIADDERRVHTLWWVWTCRLRYDRVEVHADFEQPACTDVSFSGSVPLKMYRQQENTTSSNCEYRREIVAKFLPTDPKKQKCAVDFIILNTYEIVPVTLDRQHCHSHTDSVIRRGRIINSHCYNRIHRFGHWSEVLPCQVQMVKENGTRNVSSK